LAGAGLCAGATFLAGFAACFAGFFAATSVIFLSLPLRGEGALLYPAQRKAATASCGFRHQMHVNVMDS
jgi:hypothetical protein